jgi:hypothetical protein
MKVVRRIKQVQTIARARKYIAGRRAQRKREEERRRDAVRRERANYRVTRAMRKHLDRGREGAMGDAEEIEEEPSTGEGGSGNQVDKGEIQQQRAKGAKHTRVGKREREKDVEEEGEPSKAPEEEGGQGEEGGEVRADRGGERTPEGQKRVKVRRTKKKEIVGARLNTVEKLEVTCRELRGGRRGAERQ